MSGIHRIETPLYHRTHKNVHFSCTQIYDEIDTDQKCLTHFPIFSVKLECL